MKSTVHIDVANMAIVKDQLRRLSDRVTELQESCTREVERRRKAERRLRDLIGAITTALVRDGMTEGEGD